ncbi:MAG: hypothetical protein WC107_04955 [Patescibacteria group bacterium]
MKSATKTKQSKQDKPKQAEVFSDCQITISQSMLENIFLNKQEATTQQNDWKTPFSVLISISLTLITYNFDQKSFNIGFFFVMAPFLLIWIFCFSWLFLSLLKNRSKKEKSMTHRIDKIKSEEEKRIQN